MPASLPPQPEPAPAPLLRRFSGWISRALAALCPPGIEPIWVWAEKHYYVIVSQRSGQFRIANAPWTKAIYERAKMRNIRKLVLLCAAQSGKTEILLVLMAWTVAEDPGPGMVVAASKEDVEEFWLERLLPSLRGCKPAADRIPKDDRSLAKICAIHFPGGTLEGVGAKARSKLQSRPRRYLFLDEVRNWASWALPMVLKRVRTYSKNSLTTIASTPALVGDTMDTEFNSGTQEHFHVECPACGKKLTYLRFRRVKKRGQAPRRMPFLWRRVHLARSQSPFLHPSRKTLPSA